MKSIKFFKTFFLLLFAISATSISVLAQEQSKDELKRPIQLTFVYPVGSNGIHAYRYVNNVSINILAGMSGGTDGLEIGGLANISTGHVNGVQAAGLLNGSAEYVKGLQLGGIANFNKGEFVGAQAGGISNINTYKFQGLQLAGISNISLDKVNGLQAAGISNFTRGNVYGWQLAGIANVATEKINGVQIGLINYSKAVNGFQIGLINATNEVEKGAVLGLFSFVKNGYTRMEIEANETFYANFAIKNGLPWLYNIYTVSYKTKGNKNYWAPGIGLGTYQSISDKLGVNVDLISYQVNEDEWWTEDLNMLNKLKVNLSYRLTERIELYGGPSLNVTVSGIKDQEGNIIGESFTPSWKSYEKTYSKNQVKTYVGFNFGIRL